jgi:hypothetical protein
MPSRRYPFGHAPRKQAVPFDAALLDRLMEQAGLEVLLASSGPAVQCLRGGYSCHFLGDVAAPEAG